MRVLALWCATAAALLTPAAASAQLYTDTFIGTVTTGDFLGDAAKLVISYQYPAIGVTISDNGTQGYEQSTLDPVINAVFDVGGQSFSIVGDQSGQVSRDITGSVSDHVFSQSGNLAIANISSPSGTIVSSSSLTAPFDYSTMPGDSDEVNVLYGSGLGSAFRASEVSGGNVVSPTPELPAWLSLPLGLLMLTATAALRTRRQSALAAASI